MKIIALGMAKKTFPTGNPDFSVMQAFPAAVSSENSDPFLMCDYFGTTLSTGATEDPDEFSVDWHPHRGMDICTYMKQGLGRHADSMGNRETFKSPGMQWISVGSGIEHAEGGGTPKGEFTEGFQIWLNVPAKHKMEDPKYGTENPESISVVNLPGSNGTARVLAGDALGKKGPFLTVQPMHMIDFEFSTANKYAYIVPTNFNNCVAFIYNGSGSINGSKVDQFHVMHLDASDESKRAINFETSTDSMKVLMFSGLKINEPIAWQGPFVMNTQNEIKRTIIEYQSGKFPPKRVDWDYKVLAAFPKK